MKNGGIVLFFFCAFAGTIVAEDVFSHPLSGRTREDVRAVTDRLASHTVIKASFRQTKTIARFSRSFVSTGRMVFTAERGLLWQVETPVAGATVMTKDRVAQKTAAGRISVLSSGGNDTFRRFAVIMQAVFAGEETLIEKEFEIFYRRTAVGRWEIGLVPRDRTVRSVIASLEIRGRDDLDGFILHEASGDRVDYAFSDITYPAAISPADEKAFF